MSPPYLRALKARALALGQLPRGEELRPDLPLGIDSRTLRDLRGGEGSAQS